MNSLDYGNWVRKRILWILGTCAGLTGLLLLLLPFHAIYSIPLALLFAVFLLSFLFPLYAYIAFSQDGGGLQETIYKQILEHLDIANPETLLDIGAGNGVLAVELALAYPAAQVTGIDYWGEDWEYAKEVCERNAAAMQVSDRMQYRRGDAAALEVADEAFDGVVSNLTFHEVRSVPNKREVLAEALRVTKRGGAFSFIDYFYEPKFYGAADDLQVHLNALGLAQVTLKPIQEIADIPLLLRHPKILGRVGILYGVK